MFRDLLQQVRAEASGKRAWNNVLAVSRFHRIQSSPGYDAAATWLESELSGLGLEVRRESVPGDGQYRCMGQLQQEGWNIRHARAWLIAGGRRELLCDFEGEPLSVVQRSDSASGRFRLVAVPKEIESPGFDALDLRGAVVLTGLPARQGLERWVRERGAAGLICDVRRLVHPVRGAEDDVDSLAHTSFWWQGNEPRGWGVVVTPRMGATLRQRLASGESLEIEVDIDTQRFAAPIPLVSASLPGRTNDEVLVLAHLCHPRPGAHDNGSGVAATLETARIVAALAGRRGPLERGVRFLWIPELTGTFAWLAGEAGRADRLTAALNLDMVGADQSQCGSTFLLEHPPHFAASFAEEVVSRIRSESLDWVLSYSGPGHVSMVRTAEVPYSGGSDHAVFVDPSIGVPCPMLIHWPDRYYHSSYDTPDRVDPGALELTARIAATYALFLAGAGPAEALWVLDLVGRGARRRLLAAADREGAPRDVARERWRGASAIRSVLRLGIAAQAIEREVERFERFAEAEMDPVTAATAPPGSQDARVPRRHKQGPLDSFDYMNPGWERLDRAARDSWRRVEAHCPVPVLELAWFAADGKRSITDIAWHVELETGRNDAREIGEFFELASRMGLCVWQEP